MSTVRACDDGCTCPVHDTPLGGWPRAAARFAFSWLCPQFAELEVRTETFYARAAACGFPREQANAALAEVVAEAGNCGDPWAVAMDRLVRTPL